MKSISKFDPIRILKDAGVTIRTCYVLDNILRGEFTAVKARGFNYNEGWGHPWNDIAWFSPGTGSGDGKGNWIGEYKIDLRETPAAFQRQVKQAIESLNVAELTHQEMLQKCSHIADSAKQVAWEKASQELGLVRLQHSAEIARRKLLALVAQGKTDES